MSKTFPTVGLLGSAPHAGMFNSPAQALGVELLHDADGKRCDVVTVIDRSFPISLVKGLEADGVTARPSFSALSASGEKYEKHIEEQSTICVMVARSPHGQATTWAPSEITRKNEHWV